MTGGVKAHQTARRAGQKLRNVTESSWAADLLTGEERDWCVLLQERFFEIANRRKHDD